MTNKPMLSAVLRKALADFIEYSVPGPRSDDAMWYADKQALRTLLDKPAAQHQDEAFTYSSKQATNCAGCGLRKHTPLRVDDMGGYVCLTCIDNRLGELLGAERRQVEPVAIVDESDDGLFIEFVYVEDGNPLKRGDKLYAEKPAPVADHTQCEECKGWGYHENHYEGGGTECGECGGSGNAAVAVVMPDVDELAQIIRKVDGSHNLGAGSLAEAILEEVARLNGVKP